MAHFIPKLNIADIARKNLEGNERLLSVVQAFSKYFRTNYARVDHAGSYPHAVLYLNPSPEVGKQFSITREILCFIDEAQTHDSRAFASIDEILRIDKTRLVDDALFFVSTSKRAEEACKDYMERTGRKVIWCSWRDIQAASEEFSLELLRQFLYNRDFFDVSDPVSTDGQFFARYKLVDDIFDRLLNGESCGIFGLRKIGKTSVLERLRKKNDLSNKFRIAAMDAQMPEVCSNDAAGVALEICRSFNRAWANAHGTPLIKDIPKTLPLLDASRYFRDFIQRMNPSDKPLLLIIDELERILPSRSKFNAWQTEYLHLWRLLRSESQTRNGRFVFLVASTNPFFIESARFAGEDNPLYRFIKATYLPMFSLAELSEMLRNLGKPMGVSFTDSALTMIHAECGGHPFLSRQLCSFIARDRGERPLHVSDTDVSHATDHYRNYMRSDMDAILKVFEDYYADEYTLIRTLVTDERKAIELLRTDSQAANHLLGYGLIARTKNSYRFTMDALPPFLKTEKPKDFEQESIPQQVTERHLRLQGRMNVIEPSLRQLVKFSLKSKYGDAWVDHFLKYLQPGTQEKIEAMGAVSSERILEETYLSELIATINGEWKLFENIFKTRATFREYGKDLCDIARSVSDHRKYQICAEDYKYVKADEASHWFQERLS